MKRQRILVRDQYAHQHSNQSVPPPGHVPRMLDLHISVETENFWHDGVQIAAPQRQLKPAKQKLLRI